MIFRAFRALLRKMDLCFYEENRCELKNLLQVGQGENRVLPRGIRKNGYHGTKVEGEYTFSCNTIVQKKSLIFKDLFYHRNGIQDFGEAGIWDALQEYLNDFFRSNSYIQSSIDMYFQLRLTSSGSEKAG